MPAFDSHEDGELAGGARIEDVHRRGAEGEIAGVAADLIEDAIDKGKSPMREAALPCGGLGPDGEELGGEVALAGGLEIQVTGAERGSDEVPGFVDKALRRIGVGINDESRGVNLGWVGMAWRALRHAPTLCFSCIQFCWLERVRIPTLSFVFYGG